MCVLECKRLGFGLILIAAFTLTCAGVAKADDCDENYRNCMQVAAGLGDPEAIAAGEAFCLAAWTAWEFAKYIDPFEYFFAFDPARKIVRYIPGQIVPLGAGRFDGTSFLIPQGNVTSATFYYVTLGQFAAASSFASAPWTLLGLGTFNPSDGLWETVWNTSSFTNRDGYVFEAVFADSNFPGGYLEAVDSAVPTPEPSSIYELGTFVLGFLGYGWRQRRAA